MIIDYKVYFRKSLVNERMFYLKASNISNPALKRFKWGGLFIVKDIENIDGSIQPLNINLYTLADYKTVETIYLELIKMNMIDQELVEDLEQIIFKWG